MAGSDDGAEVTSAEAGVAAKQATTAAGRRYLITLFPFNAREGAREALQSRIEFSGGKRCRALKGEPQRVRMVPKRGAQPLGEVRG